MSAATLETTYAVYRMSNQSRSSTMAVMIRTEHCPSSMTRDKRCCFSNQ